MSKLICCVLACAWLASSALAQGTVALDRFSTTAGTYYVDADAQIVSIIDEFDQQNTGLDYNYDATAPIDSAGFSAVGQVDQDSSYSPSSPGISDAFDSHHSAAYADATVATSGDWISEYAYGNSYGYVEFIVAKPTAWSIFGNAWGTTGPTIDSTSQSEYAVVLYDLLNNATVAVTAANALNGFANYDHNFSISGKIQPGRYSYEYRTFSLQGGNDHSLTVPGGAHSALTTTLTLTAVPEPATPLLTLAALAAAAASRLQRRKFANSTI